MSTTNFTDKSTVIEADWLNEVDAIVHDVFDAAATKAAARTALNIEDGATADQTGAEIKTAYEAEADTNAYTDSEKTKLAGIETSADVTDATNVNAAGAVMKTDIAAKGDLFVGTANNTLTNVGVGSNGFALVADSGEASGVKWSTVLASMNSQTSAITIADDGVQTITFGGDATCILIVSSDASGGGQAVVYVKPYAAGAAIGLLSSYISAGSVVATTGALTGTTGTDGNLTISAHTDNKVYIENRVGFSRDYQVSILALQGAQVSSL